MQLDTSSADLIDILKGYWHKVETVFPFLIQVAAIHGFDYSRTQKLSKTANSEGNQLF